jgi:hypothetical protein
MNIPKTKNFENLTNQQFGKLTVIDYIGSKWPEKRTKGHQWLCRCECGNEKIILGSSLKSGNTTSCGCYQKEMMHQRIINLTGIEYGKLTVIKYEYIKHSQPYWLCKCECGNEKIIAGTSLRFNRTKSCGCMQKFGNFKHGLSSNKKLYRKYRFQNPVVKLQHNVSTSVRDGIRERNGKKSGKTFQYLSYTTKELKDHLESLFEPWMNWDNYGGRNDSEEMTWHIDHIIPHSKFQYKSLDDPLFKECWALSNLRPLEKIKNITKNKY